MRCCMNAASWRELIALTQQPQKKRRAGSMGWFRYELRDLEMSDPDNEARLLGYWIVHIGDGFLLYRFDEARVLGRWFSTEKDLRARLAEIAARPRWRLPLRENPMIEHCK